MSRAAGLLCVLLIVANCSGTDSNSMFASAPPAASPGNAAEAARLQLIDRCMFEPSPALNVDPKKGRAPFCQCYAKAVVQGLSPQQQAALVSNGAMPWSLDTTAIVRNCSRA